MQSAEGKVQHKLKREMNRLTQLPYRAALQRTKMVQDARFFGTLGVYTYVECRKTGKHKAKAPSMGALALDNYDIQFSLK